MTDDGEVHVVTGEAIPLLRLEMIRIGLRAMIARRPVTTRISALKVANEEMGTSYRTAKAAYPAFDTYLYENYGIARKPL